MSRLMEITFLYISIHSISSELQREVIIWGYVGSDTLRGTNVSGILMRNYKGAEKSDFDNIYQWVTSNS